MSTLFLNAQFNKKKDSLFEAYKRLPIDTNSKYLVLFDLEFSRIYLADKKVVFKKNTDINSILNRHSEYLNKEFTSIIDVIGCPDFIDDYGDYFYYITDPKLFRNTSMLVVRLRNSKIIGISLAMY